jgi:phospholipase/carboxylesterase
MSSTVLPSELTRRLHQTHHLQMMNRLHSQPSLQNDLLSASAPSVASAVCTESGDVCRHSLFAPLHYERNYAYPLLVWLHGPGNDERQLRRVMPSLSMRNYVAVAPRGTLARDADADEEGFCWAQQHDHIYLAEQRAFDCIELAKRKFHVKRDRIFLAGAGCGGTMAVRLALANPDQFAGAISIGGELPRGSAPFSRVNEARRMPLLVMAGLESKRYPQPRVNDDLRLLHSAGIAVTLRLYPFADEIAPLMLADVDRWVMQQICPESTASG